MDWKQITGLVVGVVIGALLLTTIVIPVIGEATTTERTFTNDGYFYMQKITADDPDEYVFEYTYNDGATTLEFNGEPVDLGGMTNPVTLATDGDTWFVRYGLNNEYIGLQILGTELIFGGYSTTPMTITLSGGTVTAEGYVSGSETPTTYTKTYTDAYIYSPEKSDYVMKKMDTVAYMHEDTEFVAMGQTTIVNWYDSLKVLGTVEDFTVDILVPEETLTVSNKVIDASAVNGYEDLYALSKLTFTVGYDDASTDATYSYFIVPSEVTSELSQHLDGSSIALMGVIPLLITVAIMMAVVGVFVMRRE